MQKNDISKTVLAIRPGLRQMGVAVLEGKDLVFWGVAGFREIAADKVPAAVVRRIRGLIEIYEPEVLAIEKPSERRLKASPLLSDVVVRISATALSSLLYYQLYGVPTVKERLCGSQKATRQDVVEHVVAAYPHLGRHAGQASMWQDAYWIPMFAAVAVGVVCVRNPL